MFGFNLPSFLTISPFKTFVIGFVCGCLTILILA